MRCKRQSWSHVQCLCSGIGVPPLWPSFRPTILTASFRFLEREWTVAARWTYADRAFSATLPSPVPVSATGILASYAEVFAKSRELARAVSRADAILQRQPQLSDNRWAHGQESFPRIVCAAPTTTARPSSSARCFRVFCQLALPSCLLCRKMWEVTVRVPATTRQKHEGRFDSLGHDIGRWCLTCNVVLCWFARLPNTRAANLVDRKPLSSHFFLCAGLHLRRFCVECLCVALLATTRLSLEKGLGSQFLCARLTFLFFTGTGNGVESELTHRKHLRELDQSLRSFFFVPPHTSGTSALDCPQRLKRLRFVRQDSADPRVSL